MKKKTETKTAIALPKVVRKGDLKQPSYRSKTRLDYDTYQSLGTNYAGAIELWYTERFGWCIPTLLISKGKRGMPNRTYGTTLEGGQVRIGQGPHVLQQISVYVTKKNLKRLQPLLALLKKGQVSANDTRDRISTRMMNSRSYRW